MKMKVCPCCDQPIHGIYCKGCRKIVLNPVEQEITYYLNQRHPEFEENCSYHGNTAAAKNSGGVWSGAGTRNSKAADSAVRKADHRMTVSETESKKAEIRERMAAKKREQQNAPKQSAGTAGRTGMDFGTAHRTILNGETAKRARTMKNGSAVKKIVIGIVIYLIISFAGVIGLVFHQVSDVFDSFEIGVAVPEPDIAVEEVTPFEGALSLTQERDLGEAELEDWELSDEEVKAAGEACTGYGHFDVYYEVVKTEFLEMLKEDGLLCTEEEPYSYNSQMDFDSWYQKVYGFVVETETEYMGMVEIETDTATGQIHGISIYTGEEDGFFRILDSVLRFMEETGLVSEELPSGGEFYRIAMGGDGKLQLEEGVVVMFGLEVSCYVPDDMEDPDFYSISMYAPGYLTAVE